MTLTTPIKSGNVPLILLGSDWEKHDADPTKEYPYARAEASNMLPGISTSNLKNAPPGLDGAGFTLWLPTPVASLDAQPKRTLSINWSVNHDNASLPAFKPVKFQVWLLSFPSRAPNSTTQFKQFLREPVALSSETSVAISDTFGLTLLSDIEGASTVDAQGEDMTCVLRVTIPSLLNNLIQANRVVFNVFGLAVDQW